MTLLEERPAESLREASIPVLETERLVLRRPQLEDANAIAALANDRRIAENTRRIPHPYRVADAEEFIVRTGGGAFGGEMAFVITRSDGALIGGCGLVLPDDSVPEIGYWLGVSFWGQGYATEAVRALIDYAFTELDHPALQAGARVTNPASRRILEKCGFQWTGVGLVRIRAISSSAPIDQFRLDRGLWNSLRNWGAVKRVA
jgi:RimJ/RimL family protein N-acetyltransferase